MTEITIVYAELEDKPEYTAHLMDDKHALHYDNGQLWLCTVKQCDVARYEVLDYISLTRRKVDLMELYVMLRKMSALTFITDYLFRELAEIELFPSNPPDER